MEDYGTINVGAVTWSKGDSASNSTRGVITPTNSLIGGQNEDLIGSSGITKLIGNNNYVILSPHWDNGAAINAGAATWASGASAITGILINNIYHIPNSLVGSKSEDQVGIEALALTNGNYVVRSLYWGNGTNTKAGAVTWVDGTNGYVDKMGAKDAVVSATNSLVGTTQNDYLGSMGLYALPNGHFVVVSPLKDNDWDGTTIADVGAATWASGTGGTVGTITSSNSLVGSKAYDCVGTGGIAVLKGENNKNNYVVRSPYVDDPSNTVVNVGAVTWSKGDSASNSTRGVITSTNSLIGSSSNDYIGSGAIYTTKDGHYVVRSSSWNNGTMKSAGAVTWGSGSAGIAGVVSSSNSFVGTSSADCIGSGGWVELSDGRYVVGSPKYNVPGGAVDAGRVDILSGSSGGGALGNPLAFATNAGDTSSVGVNQITAILNAGTALTLQANNDITLSTALAANNAGGDGGALTLQAGRSILLNDSITTDNGALTLVANETTTNGVIDDHRDAGAAVITMASGKTIDAGSGAVSITVANGAGKTYTESGNITLQGITAGSLTVNNSGPTAGSDISLGTTTLSGSLSLTAVNGAITQSGALSVNSTTSITAGTNNVTLDNAANNFTGNVSVASAGNISIRDTNALSLGNWTVSGNLTAEAGGTLRLYENIIKSSGTDATATFKTTGNFLLDSNRKIESTSGKLNTILWADTDATSGGSIYLYGSNQITTNGGHLWMGGGSGSTTWNGLTVGNGYAHRMAENYAGVYLERQPALSPVAATSVLRDVAAVTATRSVCAPTRGSPSIAAPEAFIWKDTAFLGTAWN